MLDLILGITCDAGDARTINICCLIVYFMLYVVTGVWLNSSAIDFCCMHYLLLVQLNDSAIDLCCMCHLLHVFIGGSIERFSNIGESVALTTVCAKLVVRSTEL